jgi:uncharacterized protein (TIGR04255 family)
MSDGQLASPFGTEPLRRIHLEAAPLVKVIVQLRFPSLAVLRDESVTDRFASDFSKDYPVIQEQRGANFLLTPTGLAQQPSNQRIWSLRSGDELWKLTFGEDMLALDSSVYPKRREFVTRFAQAVEKLVELADPPYFERLGLRYSNRIDDLEFIFGPLKKMIRMEVQGPLATEPPGNIAVKHSLFDSIFIDGDYSIQTRCGVMPPRGVLDLEIPVVEANTWVLDIDSYVEKRMHFAPSEVASKVYDLADRAYRMFRWVVNDEFIKHFGGSDG